MVQKTLCFEANLPGQLLLCELEKLTPLVLQIELGHKLWQADQFRLAFPRGNQENPEWPTTQLVPSLLQPCVTQLSQETTWLQARLRSV